MRVRFVDFVGGHIDNTIIVDFDYDGSDAGSIGYVFTGIMNVSVFVAFCVAVVTDHGRIVRGVVTILTKFGLEVFIIGCINLGYWSHFFGNI